MAEQRHTPYRRTNRKPSKHFKALSDAQRLAFAPLAFQALRSLISMGILQQIAEGNVTHAQLIDQLGRYQADVLVESAVASGVLQESETGEIRLTEMGYCFIEDPMTIANFHFVADVCYLGADHLKDALEQGKPAGLQVFGTWPTIYEGLSQLPEPARTSWFRFDHLYSDSFFAEAIGLMQSHGNPEQVFDVGGNTGRFATILLNSVPGAHVTLLDLPGQLNVARRTLADFGDRAGFEPVNVLSDTPWPTGATVIWMSQFLDCFSHEQIVSILRKAAKALAPGGSIFIAEPFLDCQTADAAAYSLAQGSLYFTCMANGNSKFYTAAEMAECVREAGLDVKNAWHSLGKYQYSLMQCCNPL